MIINNRIKWDVLYSDNLINKDMKLWCSLDDNHQGVANRAKDKLEAEGFYDVIILAVALASDLYHVSIYNEQGEERREEFAALEAAFIAASKAANEEPRSAGDWCNTYLEEADLNFSSIDPLANGNQLLEEVKNKNYLL